MAFNRFDRGIPRRHLLKAGAAALVAEGLLVGRTQAERITPPETVQYVTENIKVLVWTPDGIEIRAHMKRGDIAMWVGNYANVGTVPVTPNTEKGAIVTAVVALEDTKDVVLKTGTGTGLQVNARTTRQDYEGIIADAIQTAKFQAQLTEGAGNCGLPNGCPDVTIEVFGARKDPQNPEKSVYDVVTKEVIRR